MIEIHDMRWQHVEEALARLHSVGDDSRKAFAARLRHLRNQGVPAVPRTGSGVQISYNVDHLHQIFLALELEAFDIDPRIAADFIKQRWPEICNRVGRAKDASPEKYLTFEPFFLGEVFGDAGRPLGFSIDTKEKLIANYFHEGKSHHHGRLAIIFLTRRLVALHESLDEILSG